MRTGHSLIVCRSLLLGEGGLDLIPLNFHLGCRPGSDPSQFPPWVWAWRGLLPGAVSFLWGLLGGTSFLGGLLGGVSLEGVSLEGVSFLGGLLLWGVSLGVVSHHAEADPPMNRITHSCKNITLAATKLRPVTMFGRFFTLTVVTAVVPGISTGSILVIIIVHCRRTIKWNMDCCICRILNRSINLLF